jgi:hypothetical protein
MWLCRCDCRTEKRVSQDNLRGGHTLSCGCLRVEATTTHGDAGGGGQPEYQAWNDMIARCSKPNLRNWKYYGGRGVRVCAAWDPAQGGSYQQFLADMGRRPSPHHSLDKDIRGGRGCLIYGPETCCWATKKEQQSNTSCNQLVPVNGELVTIAEAARMTGVPDTTIRNRVLTGRPLDEVFSTGNLPRRAIKHARKGNQIIPMGDEMVSVTEAAQRLGISRDRLYTRLRLGYSPAEAVTLPMNKKRPRKPTAITTG